jgi:hypothetical protein
VSSSVRVLLLTLVVWRSGEAIICAAEPPIAVGATLGLSLQPEGASEQPYLGPGFGGISLGGVLFIDVDVNARVSVGGEASLGSEVKGDQQQRVGLGTNIFSSRHHDTIFSGTVKGRRPTPGQFTSLSSPVLASAGVIQFVKVPFGQICHHSARPR